MAPALYIWRILLCFYEAFHTQPALPSAETFVILYYWA